MLNQYPLIAFVATRDPAGAKSFYRDLLGLPLLSEDGFALVFNAHGTMLRVTTVQELTPAGYTVLGWQVPDIASAASTLAASGVRFERFQGLQQDDHGIWSAPGGALVAWFKDPDGNLLSISQHEAPR